MFSSDPQNPCLCSHEPKRKSVAKDRVAEGLASRWASGPNYGGGVWGMITALNNVREPITADVECQSSGTRYLLMFIWRF